MPRNVVVSDFAKLALHDLEGDETVEFLFALYEKLTQPLTAGVKESKRRRKG